MSNFRQDTGTYQKRILEKLLHGDEVLFTHLEPSCSKTRGQIPKYKLSIDGEKVTESLFTKLVHGGFFERNGKREPGKCYKLSQSGIQKAKELCVSHEVKQPSCAKNKLTKVQLEKYHKHLDVLKNAIRNRGYELTPEVVVILEKKALEQLNTPTHKRLSFRTTPPASPLVDEPPLLRSNSTGIRNQFRRSVYLRKNIRSRHKQ